MQDSTIAVIRMRTHIDWLTFTMPMVYADTTADGYAAAVENAFSVTFDEKTLKTAFGGDWSKNEKSRAPYVDAWKLQAAGATLYASPNLNHCCVEISGNGCETLIKASMLDAVLEAVCERVTRIDVATDIETNVTPGEFTAVLSHERMRASGYQKSETGETAYIGSQKSDRYARVYRYFAPHPRSHLLRIEHVFRRDYAKSVARKCSETRLENIAASAGKAFGWSHSVWNIDAEREIDIGVTAPEKGGGKTISWLLRSVAPAFKRLVANGTIRDPEKFFREYFIGDDGSYA